MLIRQCNKISEDDDGYDGGGDDDDDGHDDDDDNDKDDDGDDGDDMVVTVMAPVMTKLSLGRAFEFQLKGAHLAPSYCGTNPILCNGARAVTGSSTPRLIRCRRIRLARDRDFSRLNKVLSLSPHCIGTLNTGVRFAAGWPTQSVGGRV